VGMIGDLIGGLCIGMKCMYALSLFSNVHFMIVKKIKIKKHFTNKNKKKPLKFQL
jgi:predicted lipid-binding transport protein (Tim44 family)